MRILAIQNNDNSVQKNTNFKSKLPKYDCKYNISEIDYWKDFALNCMQENKLKELQGLLNKLTSNFDKNYLALTTKLTQQFGQNTKSGAKYTKEYQFSLHENGDVIDTGVRKNSKPVAIYDVYDDYVGNSFQYRTTTDGINANNEESITSVLLRTLREIVTPNTKCNRAIYGYNDNKAEHFLKDYRA